MVHLPVKYLSDHEHWQGDATALTNDFPTCASLRASMRTYFVHAKSAFEGVPNYSSVQPIIAGTALGQSRGDWDFFVCPACPIDLEGYYARIETATVGFHFRGKKRAPFETMIQPYPVYPVELKPRPPAPRRGSKRSFGSSRAEATTGFLRTCYGARSRAIHFVPSAAVACSRLPSSTPTPASSSAPPRPNRLESPSTGRMAITWRSPAVVAVPPWDTTPLSVSLFGLRRQRHSHSARFPVQVNHGA